MVKGLRVCALLVCLPASVGCSSAEFAESNTLGTKSSAETADTALVPPSAASSSIVGDSNSGAPIPTFIPSPFVQVAYGPSGAYLAINGAPYRMLGYEASVENVGNYCDWQTGQLSAAFNEIVANSNANTVRMWFLQSAGGAPDTGGTGWAAFDQAISLAKTNGIRIIATLVNQWGDCEPPFSQDPNLKNYKTIQWYQSGYKAANDGYPLAYRDFAISVAARYSNEPTIAFWQLVNECEARDPTTNSCPDDAAAANAIRAFADDMVDAIHSVDGNHLINLGTQDNGYCGVNGLDYQYVHGGKIDICEIHSYDAANPALPPFSATKITQCQALDKPIFMGEMGFCRTIEQDPNDAQNTICDPNTTDPNTLGVTLVNRANYFDARFQAGFAAGLSEMLIWQWSPNAADATYGVYTGDPVESTMSNY